MTQTNPDAVKLDLGPPSFVRWGIIIGLVIVPLGVIIYFYFAYKKATYVPPPPPPPKVVTAPRTSRVQSVTGMFPAGEVAGGDVRWSTGGPPVKYPAKRSDPR